MRPMVIALSVLLFANAASFAHYNMLFPDKPWANKEEKVTFTYQFGHPFEHELFDAPKPAGLVVLPPKGDKEEIDIDKALTKIELPGADKKKVTAWRFEYTPKERGDYTFVLKTARIKLDEESYHVEDHVRVILHVQTQNGWRTPKPPYERGLDIWPYTRPYGILPGMVFRGRLVRLPFKGDSFGSKTNLQDVNAFRVEIEKYNDKPVKNPPPNELVTFETKTDADGYFLTTLPEPGWWGITALRQPFGPITEKTTVSRATLWVHVDEKK